MKRNIIYKLSLMAGLVLLMTGCLNDSLYDNGTTQAVHSIGSNKFVEIFQNASDNSNISSIAFDYSEVSTTVNLVNVHLTSPATKDVKVQYAVYALKDTLSSTTLDSLVNIDGYEIADPTKLTTVNQEVTIKKDSSNGYVQVKLKPSDFVGKSALFGVKVTSIDDTEYSLSNLTEGFVKILIKNLYDATYTCNGYRIRPGNPTETVTNEDRHLSTINGNTVLDPKFGNYSSYHENVEITSETITVGGTTCYKVIATPVDGAGNIVGGMYTTFTGDPASLPAPPANPTEINYYNPVTKTFVLNCYYVSSKNRIMYEVLVRQ
jgi:hypothetical protein